MASSTKRSWKLQDFVAHTSNVNCLALGHKSGRVLVTGGDDKKVNLWAVGKQNCIMSLSGHTTPIECVRFGQTEDLVCAGSQTGALKIWDLEHAKLARTLTGHKAGIRCMDFHPYGELLTSGSLDTAIKLWDIRRKGCIFTYKGHNQTVNSLKFSPDGQWIASAGEEGMVKLWDLRAGRQLREFSEHRGPATTVEFHPHEFLLASGSFDRTVHFWDLESFQLVSSTEQNHSASVRCLYFSQGGECLFAGSHDVLKVYGWEPARTLDTIPTGWGKIHDIAVAQNQLIGASFHIANVVLYVCDLKKVSPLGGITTAGSTFSHGNSLRKSFSRDRPPGLKKHTRENHRRGRQIWNGSRGRSDIRGHTERVRISRRLSTKSIVVSHASTRTRGFPGASRRRSYATSNNSKPVYLDVKFECHRSGAGVATADNEAGTGTRSSDKIIASGAAEPHNVYQPNQGEPSGEQQQKFKKCHAYTALEAEHHAASGKKNHFEQPTVGSSEIEFHVNAKGGADGRHFSGNRRWKIEKSSA